MAPPTAGGEATETADGPSAPPSPAVMSASRQSATTRAGDMDGRAAPSTTTRHRDEARCRRRPRSPQTARDHATEATHTAKEKGASAIGGCGVRAAPSTELHHTADGENVEGWLLRIYRPGWYWLGWGW
ncbi:hypothetical protein K3495_g6948 [Podosphaera aphanis]|nr:hypothetical protein K3495_g6948 [Podosphaera aphanis]